MATDKGVAPEISVVMPVFNRIALLRSSLESVMLAARQSGGVEIICVDQGSTDGAAEWLRSLRSVTVISHQGGTIAAMRNAGVAQSHGALCCFIDSDVVVPVGYFAAIQEMFVDVHVAGAGCEYDPPADGTWHERAWHRMNVRSSSGPRRYINAGNFAVRRAVFERVRGFDSTLVTGEDTDLCNRLIQAGCVLIESRSLATVHLGNPKTIGAFFRKQVWHGLGMSGGRPWRMADRPTVMTWLHLLFIGVAAAALGAPGPLSAGWRAALAVCALLAVPATSWGFRLRQTRQWVNPVTGVFLFEVFYAARVVALVRAVMGASRMAGDSSPSAPPSAASPS